MDNRIDTAAQQIIEAATQYLVDYDEAGHPAAFPARTVSTDAGDVRLAWPVPGMVTAFAAHGDPSGASGADGLGVMLRTADEAQLLAGARVVVERTARIESRHTDG